MNNPLRYVDDAFIATTRAATNMSICGELHLVLGPMFSGKTSELLRLVGRYEIAKRRVLLVKHRDDTRYSASDFILTTANGHSYKSACPARACADIPERDWRSADVIAIDEGQFYDDIVDFVKQALAERKIVLVAGLDGTFMREPFGALLSLVPLADTVVKLLAVCSGCGHDAPFTKRLVADAETRLIGGSEKYAAVCRACYDAPIGLAYPRIVAKGQHFI